MKNSVLREKIEQLPVISTREFELQLQDLVSDYYKLNLDADANEINKDIDSIIEYIEVTAKTEKEIAYRIYYFLSILCRRKYKLTRWKTISNKFYPIFKLMPLYHHIENIYYLSVGIPSDKYAEILDNALTVKNDYKGNSGVDHCYCDVLATIVEDSILDSTINFWDNYNNDQTKLLHEAKRIMMDILKNNDDNKYGKYHSTYARILGLLNEKEASREEFNIAISIENNGTQSYMIKQLYYKQKISTQNLIAQAKTNAIRFKEVLDTYAKSTEQITKDTQKKMEDAVIDKTNELDKKVTKRIDDSVLKNLEFLALFTGILGFLISSIGIIQNVEMTKAIGLISIIFLAFLGSFSMMDLLIKRTKDDFNKRNIIVSSICFATIIVILTITLITK